MASRNQVNEALKLQKSGRKRLGEMLAELGIVSYDDVGVALHLQRRERRRLAEILIDLGFCSEESIFSCYALQLGMPLISLSQLSNRSKLARLLPSRLAYKYSIVPVDRSGKVLVVAASEPLSDRAKGEIEKETGCRLMVVCSSHRDIEAALEQCYQKMEYSDFPVLDKR